MIHKKRRLGNVVVDSARIPLFRAFADDILWRFRRSEQALRARNAVHDPEGVEEGEDDEAFENVESGWAEPEEIVRNDAPALTGVLGEKFDKVTRWSKEVRNLSGKSLSVENYVIY